MITEAREHLAQALATLGVPVHAYSPGTVSPPAAVIVPGDPYFTTLTLAGTSASIGLEVELITSTAASAAGAATLDGLITAAAELLAGTACHLGPVPAPRREPDSGLLTVRLPVTIHWRE